MLFEINNEKYKEKDQIIFGQKTLGVSVGKHLLLLGPLSCWKTTLMNVMAGLLRVSSGDISFDGKNYASLPDRGLNQIRAENFGFVFQKLHLVFSLKIGPIKPGLQNGGRPVWMCSKM
ncbi:MAG: ATP-binding cassette domain-containing protein [Alphaproteobacteria bacterium]|nr:ATP-binding cassette domain-containing protein [Alphaproteobacteria bacterium]